MQSENSAALKEWAVTVAALAAGRQILLLRKGGIAEAEGEFHLGAREFFLYPTYEHQSADLLRREFRPWLSEVESARPPEGVVRLPCYAQVEGYSRIGAFDDVEAFVRFTIWTQKHIRERISWQPERCLHTVILRVWNLAQPHEIECLPRYGGCRSWVELDRSLSTAGAQPALSDEEFSHILGELNAIGVGRKDA